MACLEFIKERGCKVLAIMNDIISHKNDDLIIENDFGEMIRISPEQLRVILKPKNGKKLNIGMLILMIPNSHKIADVFHELGVEQIIIFNNPSSIDRIDG